MGDFNTRPNTPRYQSYVSPETGLKDAYFTVHGTFPPKTFKDGKVIDYIFFRGVDVLTADVLIEQADSLSDHFPVTATFTVTT